MRRAVEKKMAVSRLRMRGLGIRSTGNKGAANAAGAGSNSEETGPAVVLPDMATLKESMQQATSLDAASAASAASGTLSLLQPGETLYVPVAMATHCNVLVRPADDGYGADDANPASQYGWGTRGYVGWDMKDAGPGKENEQPQTGKS